MLHLQGEVSNLFGNGLSVTSGLNEMYRIGAEKMPHVLFYFRLGFRSHIAEQVAAHLLGFRGPHLARRPQVAYPCIRERGVDGRCLKVIAGTRHESMMSSYL